MEFRIADTFTASLAKLTGDEQKAVKTTAFDLQVNPASPALKLHKLNRPKDKRFLSVRVSRDIRLIVHRTDSSLLLCYVHHHDAAYRWAERRKIERHPKTGAAQLVEVRETIREIEVPKYVEIEASAPEVGEQLRLFDDVSDDDLLGYGVPAEWLADVKASTEDTLFEVSEHLPGEAAEALLEIATGGTPKKPVHAAANADPFAHPDAQRRFRVMTNVDELQQALAYPWDKWTVFLHPAQRETVEKAYKGPARVSGSAGTGKTIVALHRAVALARKHPDAKVLLTTFSETLAHALRRKLGRLAGNEPGVLERTTVEAIDQVGLQIHEEAIGPAKLADQATIRGLIETASKTEELPARLTTRFLRTEWYQVVDAWQLTNWEAYQGVSRLGRKTRLGEKQRAQLWRVFEQVRSGLAQSGQATIAGVFSAVTESLENKSERPFQFVVVDEAQDVGVPQLRFLAALAGDRPNGLFFAGDLGQRIFQAPFSWRSLGVNVRGRSRTLRINYRTSHQIRRQADRLLPGEIADVDGNTEVRRGTVSAFNGPEPEVSVLDSIEAEASEIAGWLEALGKAGVLPRETGVFVRSKAQLSRVIAAIEAAGLTPFELDGSSNPPDGRIAVTTMHLAKGLEFRAVVVAACDDEIVPLQDRIEGVVDESDLQDVYDTERHLLYVACTRAREHLLVTGVDPASEFLDDLVDPRTT
jgi:superfamily I DNA/RNA helicase/mRNA-degrading endonuclease RelE of RelBE toxin-antitoxin system